MKLNEVYMFARRRRERLNALNSILPPIVSLLGLILASIPVTQWLLESDDRALAREVSRIQLREAIWQTIDSYRTTNASVNGIDVGHYINEWIRLGGTTTFLNLSNLHIDGMIMDEVEVRRGIFAGATIHRSRITNSDVDVDADELDFQAVNLTRTILSLDGDVTIDGSAIDGADLSIHSQRSEIIRSSLYNSFVLVTSDSLRISQSDIRNSHIRPVRMMSVSGNRIGDDVNVTFWNSDIRGTDLYELNPEYTHFINVCWDERTIFPRDLESIPEPNCDIIDDGYVWVRCQIADENGERYIASCPPNDNAGIRMRPGGDLSIRFVNTLLNPSRISRVINESRCCI